MLAGRVFLPEVIGGVEFDWRMASSSTNFMAPSSANLMCPSTCPSVNAADHFTGKTRHATQRLVRSAGGDRP